MPSTFNYSNGDGHTVLDSATPVGATDPVSVLDQSDQQIKKFLKDTTAGLAKILGPTGQLYLLRVGTSNPTPAAGENYMFYNSSTGVLYQVVNASLIPLMPGGGAVAGKILTSAGLATVPTWSKMIPSRGIVECHTTLSAAPLTDVQMSLTGTGLPTGISINSGNLRVATGYTILVRGMASGAYNAELYHRIQDITSLATVQNGFAPSAITPGYHAFSAFDFTFTNATGGNVDLQLQTTFTSGTVQTASSTWPNARLVVEVHPN